MSDSISVLDDDYMGLGRVAAMTADVLLTGCRMRIGDSPMPNRRS